MSFKTKLLASVRFVQPAGLLLCRTLTRWPGLRSARERSSREENEEEEMERKKWVGRSEIFLFIHLMPSFLVLVMIVLVFLVQCDLKKRLEPQEEDECDKMGEKEVWTLTNLDLGWRYVSWGRHFNPSFSIQSWTVKALIGEIFRWSTAFSSFCLWFWGLTRDDVMITVLQPLTLGSHWTACLTF